MFHYQPPLETRDEGDADPMAEATRAVSQLQTSVADFQTRAEERITTGFREVGDRVTALEARLNRPGAGAGSENRTDEDELQTRAAFDRYLRHGRDALSAEEQRSLSVTGDGATGANVVPEVFLNEIVRELGDISPMRSLARVTQVGGTPVLLPRRTGKPSGAWEGETDEAGESSSSYAQWSIDVHEARVHTAISQRLLEDSQFDMQSEIAADLAEAFAELEAPAFVEGDGDGKPLGFLEDEDFSTVNAAVIDAEDALVDAALADALIDHFYSIGSRYRQNGTWAMSGTTTARVRKLRSEVDGRYLWQESLAAGQPPTLLGRPVVEMPDLPDIEVDAVPVVFGDWNRAYRIVQRLAMTILPDRYSAAKTSQVLFHARARVGGKLVAPFALKGMRIAAIAE
jgi:HK97 family phage major capsid protein